MENCGVLKPVGKLASSVELGSKAFFKHLDKAFKKAYTDS
jgi:hypothetical protein